MQFYLPPVTMTVIFYHWDHSIFQHQTMYKSSVKLGLVHETFITANDRNKQTRLRNSFAALEKQTASTLAVFGTRIQLFNSVNNSECIKYY